MADTCNCPPASNIYCLGVRGLAVSQPTCQIIPSGDRVENPYFDTEANITYFTYGLLNNCAGTTGNIEDFLTLICENIPLASVIRVDQRLDTCEDFSPVNFDFNNSGGQQPPPGFRYLRIIVNEELTDGASAVYRIALAGNYPAETFTSALNAFVVIATGGLFGFLINTTFPATVPGCPLIPRLTVMKSCNTVIENNTARVEYSVMVGNTGNVDLDNVLFNDIINYNGSNITIGTVTVEPPTINVDTRTSGIIRLTGDLGTINIGESVEITYTVPVVAFSAPGTYTFANTAMASSADIQGSSQCNATIEVVELTNTNCCTVNNDLTANFQITVGNPNSPGTSITLGDVLTVPANLALSFTSFDVCSATFVSTGENVPLNTPISGEQIAIECMGLLPQGATDTYTINFTIDSTSQFGGTPLEITNTLLDISLDNPGEQILLGINPALPNTSVISVNGNLACQTQ